MNSLNNLKTSVKLVGSYLIIALIIVAVSILGFFNLKTLSDSMGHLFNNNTIPIGELGEVNKMLITVRGDVYKYMLVPQEKQANELAMNKDITEASRLLTSFNNRSLTQVEKEQLDTVNKKWVAYQTAVADIITKEKTGDHMGAIELLLTGAPAPTLRGEMAAALDKLITIEIENANQSNLDGISIFTQSANTMILAGFLGILLAIGFGIVISRSITNPLAGLALTVQSVAHGDLNQTIQEKVLKRKDEIGVISLAFESMIVDLNATLGQTNMVTNQVVQAVEQVRSVSQDLASNAQEQSAAVEEVASSIEETDSQVRACFDHAKIANQLATHTNALADLGKTKMGSLSESMSAISRSSLEMSKILKVIDEIAFQTNLLALNAAVEAARAGQYGKGFAVVAQEVRNLAERSAKAAKSTAELIEDSSRRVQEGVATTAETAASFNEIVQNIIKVKDLVSEMEAASEEQTKALNQISQATSQVSQGVQTNSSQSEELASTADELGGLAEQLQKEVDRFQLRQNSSEQMFTLPAGMPAAVYQSAVSAWQKSNHIGVSKGAKPIVPLKKNLDRDERGYAHF